MVAAEISVMPRVSAIECLQLWFSLARHPINHDQCCGYIGECV